jgi:hypothetical protein
MVVKRLKIRCARVLVDSRFGNRICCKVPAIFFALYALKCSMFCSNDCFSADCVVYSLEDVVCSG